MSGSSTNFSQPDLAQEKDVAEPALEGGGKDISSGLTSSLAEDEYPSGLKLGMIVVALMLSMFLVRNMSILYSISLCQDLWTKVTDKSAGVGISRHDHSFYCCS